MADGSSSHLTAEQQLELALAIKQRTLDRYADACFAVARSRERLIRMTREMRRRKVQCARADADYYRVLDGAA